MLARRIHRGWRLSADGEHGPAGLPCKIGKPIPAHARYTGMRGCGEHVSQYDEVCIKRLRRGQIGCGVGRYADKVTSPCIRKRRDRRGIRRPEMHAVRLRPPLFGVAAIHQAVRAGVAAALYHL